MALFRRKRRPDYIDLGDQVAVSPERAEELARIASLEILERAEEPLWEPVIDAIALSIQRRHPSDDGDENLRDWLVQIAVPGYWARRYEEDLESTEEVVSSLTDRLAEWLGANESVSGAISEVCLDLCDSAASDPGSPRSLDAIPGIGDLRPDDQIQDPACRDQRRSRGRPRRGGGAPGGRSCGGCNRRLEHRISRPLLRGVAARRRGERA